MQDTFSGNDEALDKLSQLASVADDGSIRQQLSAFVDEFDITTKMPASLSTVHLQQPHAQEHSSELLAAVRTVTRM